MDEIARFITTVAENVDNEAVIEKVGREVLLLNSQFPVPDHFIIPAKRSVPFADEAAARLADEEIGDSEEEQECE